ncbi:hypothetical protein DAPPUDRAFT_319124 [Daphnia pulex]|uniref:Uncharacterized protein n=1 Tax=Daphnia pulex TaxID=6669 RepID=E9GKR8_DAPPU|nr:hypothetical protein DAPPUDRAFT_319124 [Daphnia pulex]|eukprot:EFX79921.1 hypothetical protein DAPPUDRAFT_319124 [Daphnia pulex]
MNDQQVLKCISLKKYFLMHWNYSWEPIKPFSKELDCGSSKVPTESPREMPVVDEPYGGTTKNPFIEETHDFGSETQTNDSARSLPVNFPRDLLIGICSFLGLIMIAVLFGILYKNKTRLGKRYNDTANHTRQSPFTSMPEGENKSKEKFADGEENLAMYANIIPIKVNQETIYAEVETGKIGKSRPTNIKLTIDDDQLHTTYAEILHSVIPEDQR